MIHPITVILPCYNEEFAIRDTLLELSAVLGEIPHQIIVVDDGSDDLTPQVLQVTATELSTVRVITHPQNQGYGAALKTGFRKAETELVVITDVDGTYPHHHILDLLDVAQQADMVVGARVGDGVEYPLLRKIPKWFFAVYCSWLTNRKIPDINSGLRVLRRDVVLKFLKILPDGFSFTTTITLAMLTNHYDVRYIPITYLKRIGKSKIRPIRDTLMFMQLIIRTGTYFAPLRVFMPFSLLFLIFLSFSLLFDVFIANNLTDKTMMLLILFLNTTMFALLADMIDKRT